MDMPRRVQRSIKKRVVAGENAADLRVIVVHLLLQRRPPSGVGACCAEGKVSTKHWSEIGKRAASGTSR